MKYTVGVIGGEKKELDIKSNLKKGDIKMHTAVGEGKRLGNGREKGIVGGYKSWGVRRRA